METADYLIVPMLQGFVWLDEGLQNFLRHKGWPDVTRPQSMVMVTVVMGVTRPSDIARILGVSRQAVHTTIGAMIKLGMLDMVDDADDRRSKIVVISARGETMRAYAREAFDHMGQTLAERIGEERLEALREALSRDWGPPVACFEGERDAEHLA